MPQPAIRFADVSGAIGNDSASLNEIYERVYRARKAAIDRKHSSYKYKNVIRSIIYANSADSEYWHGKDDCFEAPYGLRKGIWKNRNVIDWHKPRKPNA